MKALDLANFDGLLGNTQVVKEIRKMERERSSWMNAMDQSHSLADQIKKIVEADSSVVQMVKRMHDAQKAQEESIRKMLDPLAHIRSSLLSDSTTQRMLAEFSKPISADHITKFMDQATGSNAFVKAMNSSVESSIGHARKMLAEASVSSGLQQIMKSFEEADKRWSVPSVLFESLSPLKALQEQMGKLSLPVMDVASAAALANLLGRDGIESQLAAWGINPDGSINAQFVDQEDGIGLSRKSMELMALLSFILAILLPIYQEISSSQWQAATDQKLEAQADALEGQKKMIEALTKLVEKALVQEAKRQEERFVVKDRVAVVRSKPEHGSAVVGKLLPQEVVRPISEDGKWIEFEYYHWLHQEYRTGWALKKYFQRVARVVPLVQAMPCQPEAQSSGATPLTQLIGKAQGCYENTDAIDTFIRSERDAWDR
ncbi:MAG: SH3 domain-containing protein [Gallionella sp.]|nr:SH3 domain-containing protein [Gallionella sp.]